MSSLIAHGARPASRHHRSFLARHRLLVALLSVLALLVLVVGVVGIKGLVHAQRPAAANPNTAVTTYKGDVARDGDYPNETSLTTSNVNVSSFGRRISYPLDGQVYAQPLFVPNVSISGSSHNVVFAATEHDSMYALDADATGSASALWHRSFLGTNVTTVPAADTYGKYPNHDIDPEIGITGTPVIDTASGTLYVVAMTKENGSSYVQRLHALDLTTGNDKAGSPVVISATVNGSGYDSSGGKITFNSKTQNQRVGLLLLAGNVYITWSSFGDTDPYHGWIIGYNYTGSAFNQVAAWADTPNGQEGGIWMGGGALAAGPTGTTIYLATGNGTFDVNTGGPDVGDSVLKLDTSLNRTDYFTPFNQDCLNNNDTDLGSGGVLVLPSQTGAAAPDVMLAGGKEGRLYLINRSNLGQYNTIANDCNNQSRTDVDKVLQELPPGTVSGGVYSTPAYWQGPSAQYVYETGSSDHIKAFTLSNGLLSTAPSSQSTESFGFPGGDVVVSSNGSTAGTGIVWDISPDKTLRAYDATNLGNEIYNSGQNASRDGLSGFVKFSVPTVGNGRIFVGTGTDVNSTDAGTLDVFGLLGSSGPTPSYAINSGGGAAGNFSADNFVSGGQPASFTPSVSTTGVTNPAPQAVYQTERYGNFTYTLPNLIAGDTYFVRLHFSENYWSASGKRVFNVTLNGSQVLTNFDIFAAAGGQNKAIVKTFTTKADSSGKITIQYTTVTDNAKSSGIEVYQSLYEAETATLSGPLALAEHPGYTGSGYADYQNASNDYVQWSVNVPTSGTYTLTWRYANGGTGDRPLAIAVNGTTVDSSLSFPATGDWAFWKTVSLTATLNAGTNTIRATAIGQSGGNVDNLTISDS